MGVVAWRNSVGVYSGQETAGRWQHHYLHAAQQMGLVEPAGLAVADPAVAVAVAVAAVIADSVAGPYSCSR